MSTARQMPERKPRSRVVLAWLALVAAVGLHVVDEALTGFLSVYNPTAAALRTRWGTPFPPSFEFEGWLAGLAIGIVLLLLLTPVAAYRGWRVPMMIFAGLMVLNGIGHTAGSIFGRSVAGVTFSRPMPGFYSSPFLILAALWFLAECRARRD